MAKLLKLQIWILVFVFNAVTSLLAFKQILTLAQVFLGCPAVALTLQKLTES